MKREGCAVPCLEVPASNGDIQVLDSQYIYMVSICLDYMISSIWTSCDIKSTCLRVGASTTEEMMSIGNIPLPFYDASIRKFIVHFMVQLSKLQVKHASIYDYNLVLMRPVLQSIAVKDGRQVSTMLYYH